LGFSHDSSGLDVIPHDAGPVLQVKHEWV
jgi:hypothetical protein